MVCHCSLKVKHGLVPSLVVMGHHRQTATMLHFSQAMPSAIGNLQNSLLPTSVDGLLCWGSRLIVKERGHGLQRKRLATADFTCPQAVLELRVLQTFGSAGFAGAATSVLLAASQNTRCGKLRMRPAQASPARQTARMFHSSRGMSGPPWLNMSTGNGQSIS